MGTFQTLGLHGYSIEFSPYLPHRVCSATSQNFGIAGCGSLFVLDQTPSGLLLYKKFEWNEGLFDSTWSENNENVIVTGSGDGAIQIWDISHPEGPVKSLREHTKEVYSVDWNPTRANHLVVSGSWDRAVKLWDPVGSNSCLATYSGHQDIVYAVVWSPHLATCFASASGDRHLNVWDAKGPSGKPQLSVTTGPTEVLTCDWCKYDQNVLVSGSVDGLVRGWDLRNPSQPVFSLAGHSYAVRRLKCSPHQSSVVASCSYDFSVCFWDFSVGGPAGRQLEKVEHHTEFVCGLDFNLHVRGQVADCGWDQKVAVYSPVCLQVQG